MIKAKNFLRDPPRITTEVKDYINTCAHRFIQEFIDMLRIIDAEQIVEKHIRLVLFMITIEPVCGIIDDDLCYYQGKFKNILKTFSKALERGKAAREKGDKYWSVEKHTFLTICKNAKEKDKRLTKPALAQIAICVNEICGILMANASKNVKHTKSNTLGIEHIKNALVIRLDHCNIPHTSFLRFLQRIEVAL